MFDHDQLTLDCGEAAAADISRSSDAELCDAALALERARALLDAAEAHVVAELGARGITDTEWGMTTAAWLAHHARLSRRTAKARVDAGRTLRHLEQVDAALLDGRLSSDHVHVLAAATAHPRVGAVIGELQAALIELADGMVFERWRSEIGALIELLDQDGPDPDDLDRNQLSAAQSLDGSLHLGGVLVGERALRVFQTIEEKADELFRWYSEQHRAHPDDIAVPSRKVLRALAIDEICRLSKAVDLRSTKAPRTEATFVINAQDPLTAFDPSGVRLQDGTTRLLGCDPVIHAVIVDHLGVPLDLARDARYATIAQRNAITVRDGGCVFPGCDAPVEWLDIHHLHHWVKGGHTNVDLMCGGCRRHHGIWHRTGWNTNITDDGWIWFQTPSGRTFWGQRHGKQRAGPAPPAAPETKAA